MGYASHVGFTGTRNGMTGAQHATVQAAIAEHPEWSTIHHGGCVGADAEMHEIARAACRDVVVHRSTHRLAAELAVDVHVSELAPLPPLERNRAIVDAVSTLIAAPAGMAEVRRSGTWATVRYARRTGTPVIVAWPDGTTSLLHPNKAAE